MTRPPEASTSQQITKSESTPTKHLPSRNPIPLSASQEGEVKQAYYKRVRGLCAQKIQAYADCATGRTFSAVWACSEQKQAMNSCMIAHATVEEEDRAREEWFAQREERQRNREKIAEKQRKQDEFRKLWWGIDESGTWGHDLEKDRKKKP